MRATFGFLALCTLLYLGLNQARAAGPVLRELHRYYNGKIGDHFYTVDHSTEYSEQLATGGYKYEGIAGRIFQSPQNGAVPLHRYFNGKINDHFYTTSFAELGGGKGDYVHERIEGYVFPQPVLGTLPLYRYYHPSSKDHFYTTNWNELGGGKEGWTFESIQAYIFP